jgi:hypothetical protein
MTKVVREDKQRLHQLLSDAIPLLCKNGLALNTAFRVQAMIGITVIDTNDTNSAASIGDDLILVCFQQTVSNEGFTASSFGGDTDLMEASAIQQKDVSRNAQQCRTGNIDHRVAVQTVATSEEEVLVKREPKLEPTDATDGADMLYNTNEEDYDENDVQYIEDDDEYEGEEGEYEPGEQEDYDDGCSYYDDSYAGNNKQTEFKSEPQDGGTYAGSSGYAQIKQDYEEMPQFVSASSTGSSRSIQQSHVGMQQQSSASRGAHVPSTTGAGTPVRQRRRGGSLGGTPRSKAPRSIMPKPSSGGSFVGLGQHNGIVQDLCQSLIRQSTVQDNFFICHVCSAKLSSARSLRDHIRGTHLALKTFQCAICGETFKYSMQLTRHRKCAHDSDGMQILTNK